LDFDDDAIFCSIKLSIQFGLFGSTVSLNMKREHDLTLSSLSVFTYTSSGSASVKAKKFASKTSAANVRTDQSFSALT
jgi:hypothetical protein